MTFVEPAAVAAFFQKVNRERLPYAVIRNIDSELPDRLKIGKDIDLLVPYGARPAWRGFLTENGFHPFRHPHAGDRFLYGAAPFDFFGSRERILLDFAYQLVCRSLNAGEWIPLHQTIQESAWQNRRMVKEQDGVSYHTLGKTDEFVMLIVRSIFDKKIFENGYIRRIEALRHGLDMADAAGKLTRVFFRFTPLLLALLDARQYGEIRGRYLSFTEY